MRRYCETCWAELPGPCDGACDDQGAVDTPGEVIEQMERESIQQEGFDGLVDKLQALRGIDRDEAEKLAEDILEDDAS